MRRLPHLESCRHSPTLAERRAAIFRQPSILRNVTCPLATEWARQQRARGIEAAALYELGAIQTHGSTPDVTQAEARYQEALTLADELRMRPLVARCHLGLGKLYRRTEKREQAHEHLTTALSMYREMDMRFYLKQAEAERGALA